MTSPLHFFNAHSRYRIHTSDLRRKAEILLKKERHGRSPVNVIFGDDKLLHTLNRRFRKKNRITNVLSFPFNEPDLLGEIYISMERTQKEAADTGTPFYFYLWQLLAHGLLHLIGFRHKQPSEREGMEKKEAFYAAL